jgi:long-chain acyl-CoA synthetase
MASAAQRTIPQLFEDSVARYPGNILMWEKRKDAYQGTAYLDFQLLVHQCACGLIRLGIGKGDRVALIAEGRNDWVISELGVLFAGAINVPLSVKIDELSDLKFRLAHSGCRDVIVSGGQVHKVRAVKNDLPELEKIILLDGEPLADDEITFKSLLAGGISYLAGHKDEFESRWHSINENDPANICYTSGTTADPKGIVLTHRNYTANVEQSSALLPIPEWYCSLLILPWDHAFAHTAGIYTLMKNGASMASVQLGKTPAETLKNIPSNIKEIRPAFLLSVPSLAKNFRKNIEKGIRGKGERVAKLFQKALDLAYAYNGNGWNRGKNTTAAARIKLKLYDLLIFKKIRKNFGGRLEFFIGGGALLDIELQRFFYAVGVPMFQGYGLTESAPVISANVPKKHKLGSSGSIVPGLLLKICDEKGNELPAGQQGEIVVKGENVMAGYWKNEKASHETIRDGWLYTGDLGYVDTDGFLYVLGRAKSLLIGHDGEKYSPEGIEEAMVGNSPYIDQVMLHNNQSLYTVALMVPNRDNVLKYLKDKGLSPEDDSAQNEILKLLEFEISEYRSGGKFAGEFPERWLPAAIAVLGEGFTEQNHFLNSTLKMVRGKIFEFYKDRIDFLFTPEGKDICNHQNRMIIRRMGQLKM